MKRIFTPILALTLLAVFGFGRTVTVHEYTRKDGTVVHEHTREIRDRPTVYSPSPVTATGQVERTPTGRIKRSSTVRRDFMAHTICPSTHQYSAVCPGYIVDHVVPLACGGADNPNNMQYQTTVEAAAKDKWERERCGGQ